MDLPLALEAATEEMYTASEAARLRNFDAAKRFLDPIECIWRGGIGHVGGRGGTGHGGGGGVRDLADAVRSG